jgi:hypothetical protein
MRVVSFFLWGGGLALSGVLGGVLTVTLSLRTAGQHQAWKTAPATDLAASREKPHMGT